MTLKDDADRLDAAMADFKRALWEHRWDLIPYLVLFWFGFFACYLVVGLVR